MGLTLNSASVATDNLRQDRGGLAREPIATSPAWSPKDGPLDASDCTSLRMRSVPLLDDQEAFDAAVTLVSRGSPRIHRPLGGMTRPRPGRGGLTHTPL